MIWSFFLIMMANILHSGLNISELKEFYIFYIRYLVKTK